MSQGKQPDTKSTDAAFSSDVSGLAALSALICWHARLQLVGLLLDVFILRVFSPNCCNQGEGWGFVGKDGDKNRRK